MVRFCEYLESNKLEKWSSPRNYYINYAKLKALIENKQWSEFDSSLEAEIMCVDTFYELQMDIFNTIKDCRNEEELKKYHIEADELRHYVLLNTIGFIKIIKKKNKNIEDCKYAETDIIVKMKKYKFYKCERLIKHFAKLGLLTKKHNIKLLQANFEKSPSFNMLKTYNKFQPKFNNFHKLPFCSDESIQKYFKEKLGEESAINKAIKKNREYKPPTLEETSKNQIKISCTTQMHRGVTLLFSLYFFLLGLGLMGDSFKAMSGKSVGTFFNSISNPIAGLMVGVLATVLLQSSSTTTSVIVSMVGAGILTVQTAIPVIMGANIGTSVTNTIVSHGHIHNLQEFKRAFTGATVHDLFNLLSVIILLPVEVISKSLGFPFLFNLTKYVMSIFIDVNVHSIESPIKIIISPISNLLIKVDKDIIKAYATGCQKCVLLNATETDNYCWSLDKNNCETHAQWDKTLDNSNIIESGVLKDLGDRTGSIVGVIVSLVILCIALFYLIRTLQKIILSGNSQGFVLSTLRRILHKSAYLSIFFGMILTILLQSSSITTSTFTPLVGLNIITLEQMFPLTLGANIGTTCTAVISALVSGSVNAIQISMCHFFFNIIGIVIWYPVPQMRQIPLNSARRLGVLITEYRWFGGFYLLYLFIILPGMLWAVSLLLTMNSIQMTVISIFLNILLICGSGVMFYKFDKIISCLTPRSKIIYSSTKQTDDEVDLQITQINRKI